MTEYSRRFERVPLALRVRYRTAGAFLVAYTTNLSKGGLFLETRHPLPVGSEITLSVEVPQAPTPIVIPGMVAWVRPAADAAGNPPGMGVQFGVIDERYGALIDTLVASFQGLRVLVMSLDSDVRAMILRYLKTIISAQAIEAVDGETAEAVLQESHVDLVFVDLDDIAEGGRALKAARSHPAQPVPAIAVAASDEVRSLALELGASIALGNPPVFAELQAAVIRCLAQPTAVG